MYYKISFTLLCFLLINTAGFAQKFTIQGFVEDGISGEKLIAASIFDATKRAGVSSNTYGFFSLTLPKDTIYLTVSYIGYEAVNLVFYLQKDTTLNIRLMPEKALAEVVITDKKQDKIQNQVQMSKIEVPIQQIKRIPALMGEVDVLKALQLLPGVQGGGEGQSGIYVRGGSPDQNLILLDGVPVYNVSHLLGFFSVFNADAIKNVTLVKGGFPARYGGRLSSVIDINMKEGNNKEFHGEGSLGLIASKLTLEGPIVKDKASFMISGRRTYADFIFKPLIALAQASATDKVDPTLYFYDLNAKVNYKINDKHQIYLSSYLGSDVFKVKVKNQSTTSDDFYNTTGGTNWGNATTAFRWNYLINNKLFSNLTFTYSKFDFNFLAEYEEAFDHDTTFFSARYISQIYDWAGKMDFDYVLSPNHYVRFGGGATYHTYNPGAFQLKAEFENIPLDTILGSKKTYSWEPYIYIEDEMRFGALMANVGLHFSGFFVDDVFYNALQPRLGLNYLINDDIAIKASYASMKQYINLLTNEALSLPTDLWVPSTAKIKPQEAWQVAMGLAKTFGEDFEVSLEGYYKPMKNVLSYKEGTDFIGLQNDWQDKVTQGNGKSYGIELFVQKKTGKTTGWIGYTLSRTTRQFEEINRGEEYDFKYDRRHDFEMVVSHQFNPGFTISATWVYGTGNAISLPIETYQLPVDNNFIFNGIQLQDYDIIDQKNAFRMKAYHRLDIGLEFHKKKKGWERTWALGAYNAYSNNNPYYVYAGRKYFGDTGESRRAFFQVSLFPIIPYISYNFKF